MLISPTLALTLTANTLAFIGPLSESNQLLLQPDEDESVVLFTFPGGTAADYVEAVRTRARALDVYVPPINVISSPGLEAITINPVDLIAPDQDFFDDAIAAITDQTHFIEPGVTAQISSTQFGLNMNFRIFPEFLIEKGSEIIESPVPPNYKSSNWHWPEMAEVAAYPVGSGDAQSILDAVSAAIELGKLGEMTEIMVHGASGTLLVRGTPDVHALVVQVINAVREQSVIRKDRMAQQQDLEREIQERVKQAHREGMDEGLEESKNEIQIQLESSSRRIHQLESVIIDLEARLQELATKQSAMQRAAQRKQTEIKTN